MVDFLAAAVLFAA